MVKMLSKRSKLFTGLKNATVSHLGNTADGVDVHFDYQDQGNVVYAKYAVFAGQLKVAPKLIDGLNEKAPEKVAVKAVERMEQLFTQLPKNIRKGSLSIKKVETNRWPYSVRVPTPGYYTTKARILRHPFGNIYFANNNIGTPAFEEALFRGHCAATNILKHFS